MQAKGRKTFFRLNIFAPLLFLIIPAFGQTNSSNGSVCVAPVSAPNNGEKSLSNPSGGNHIQIYEVQIDNKSKIKVSNTESVKIGGLSTKNKHRITIFGDGKAVESFRFSFSDHSSNKLCLWFKSLYETWSLWTTKEAGKICQCK